MSLDRILSIIATSLGFSGSILLAKSIVLKLTPNIIAKRSITYWGYNKEELENIISQKADALCGVSLIFLAFFTQIINLIFVYHSLKILPGLWAVILIVCTVSLILTIVFFVNKFLVKQYRIDSCKSLARQRLEQDFKQNKISYSGWESLLKDAQDLCNINKRDNESPVNFLKRYLDFLGVKIPDNIDLSELEKKNKVSNE